MTSLGDRAEAVFIADGRIQKVGEERAILRAAHAAGAPVYALGGRRVVPGLIDSHTHLVHQGLLRTRVDLHQAPSKAAALSQVRRAARAHRGNGPLLAERWDESAWPRREWPTREDLDEITTRFPLVLRRVDGHIAVANTAALTALHGKLAGVDLDRGLLIEEASLNLNRVWPTPVVEATTALALAQETALRLGVTTVHDFVTPTYFRAFQTMHRAGRLKIRAQATPYVESLPSLVDAGVETGLGDDRLWVGGVKVFADGSLGGHTAALREPYGDHEGHGKLNWTDAQLRAHVDAAGAAGLQPSIHAIGDAAIDQVLDAYSRLKAPVRRRLRPRIEHFEVHHPDQVERARDLGVVLSMQPNFVGTWSAKGGMYEDRLGHGRYRRTNEFRALLAKGASLAFGSDCMPFDPWWGLESAVRAPHAAQRLTPEAALWQYTAGSAYGLRHEATLGRLAPGHKADLVVVRGDWRRKGGLAKTRVAATMVSGRVVSGRLPRAAL